MRVTSVASLTGIVATVGALFTVPAPADNSLLRMCRPGEWNTSAKTCVVDGDTLWLRGINYRMKGYGTPEPQSNICGGELEVALAHSASARFLELLNASHWTLRTFGREQGEKRILASIFFDGHDVGDILIAEHLARRWPDGRDWWCN